MSERNHDIVERLKIAQANTASIYPVRPKLLQDAIDEIVALRVERDRLGQFVDGVKHHGAQARDAALEEAAQACVGSGAIVREARLCASAIRALKDKR